MRTKKARDKDEKTKQNYRSRSLTSNNGSEDTPFEERAVRNVILWDPKDDVPLARFVEKWSNQAEIV